MKHKSAAYFLALLLLLFLPTLGVYPVFAMKVMCYALFACAFNLLLGYTGLLSFGHAAFLGGAAYATGMALTSWGFPTVPGILFGSFVAGLMGLVIGALAVRRSGIHFAMITLAMAQMVFFYFLQAPFTGGEDGLQGIPRGSFIGLDLGNDTHLYYLVCTIFVLAFLCILRIVHSPFGQVLRAIRENEPRAISLGYSVNNYKLIAFVLSAVLAGLAGATKAVVFDSATLSDAAWHMSGLVVLMTLIGGVGTFSGPVIGAVIIVLLEGKVGEFGHFLSRLTGVTWFQGLGESVTIVIGLIFVLCVLAFRRGIVGELVSRVIARPDAEREHSIGV